MKGILLAGLLLLQPLPTPPNSADERDAVMTALLHELAGEQRRPHHRPAGRPICVDPTLGASPIAGTRQPPVEKIISGQPPNPLPPETEEETRARLWWIDPDVRGEERTHYLGIQNAAFAASAFAPKSAGARIDLTWLAPNQRIDEGECEESQSFSEPDIALDHAFVRANIQCGALCGMSVTLVMRRDEGKWSIIDGRIHFIS